MHLFILMTKSKLNQLGIHLSNQRKKTLMFMKGHCTSLYERITKPFAKQAFRTPSSFFLAIENNRSFKVVKERDLECS